MKHQVEGVGIMGQSQERCIVPESGIDQTAGRHRGSWQIYIYPSSGGKLRLRFSLGNVVRRKAERPPDGGLEAVS